MPDTFGFVAASVEAHRLAGEGFLRCASDAVEIRRLVDERRVRAQLRAADWQDNDMAVGLRVEMMLNLRCRWTCSRFLDPRAEMLKMCFGSLTPHLITAGGLRTSAASF
jgi:hypothetical protein